QDQLHPIAELTQANFLIDLPEFARQIKRGGPLRVGGEEQDLDRLHPDLKRGATWRAGVGARSHSLSEATIRLPAATGSPSFVSGTAPALCHRSASASMTQEPVRIGPLWPHRRPSTT